ncbi:hypothetical protein L227DRAFT_653129, partial [Lentinus tigrinus ALCF2SS1-6]
GLFCDARLAHPPGGPRRLRVRQQRARGLGTRPIPRGCRRRSHFCVHPFCFTLFFGWQSPGGPPPDTRNHHLSFSDYYARPRLSIRLRLQLQSVIIRTRLILLLLSTFRSFLSSSTTRDARR